MWPECGAVAKWRRVTARGAWMMAAASVLLLSLLMKLSFAKEDFGAVDLGGVSVKLEHRIEGVWPDGTSILSGKQCTGEAVDPDQVQAAVDEPCGYAGLPCPVRFATKSKSGKHPPCNSCLILTVRQPEVKDEHCAGGVCPAFQRSLLTRVAMTEGDPRIKDAVSTWANLPYQAWQRVCPFTCLRSDGQLHKCVAKAKHCADGVVESYNDSQGMKAPGSAQAPPYFKTVAWHTANCTNAELIGDAHDGQVGFLPSVPTHGGHKFHYFLSQRS